MKRSLRATIDRHPYVSFLRAHPVLARFWAGSLLSALGDTLAWTTLIWYVVDRAGGGPAVAVLLLAQAIPGMLSAPLFGRWLDHGPLRSILMFDNAARAAVTAALPGKGHADAELDDLLQQLAGSVQSGDHVLVMSNGGFGGLHRRLLAALSQRAT